VSLRAFDRLILHNGVVHTLDDHATVADAIGFAGGRVTAVGTRDEVRRAMPEAAERDLDGATVLPGFIDAHHHFCFAATFAGFPEVRCPPLRRLSQLLVAVAREAQRIPEGQWIVLGGFDETQLDERRRPTREELDAAAPAHPVLLIHFSYHEGVLNSLGLRRAGLAAGQSIPHGGWLGRTRHGGLDGGVYERCFGHAEAVARADVLATDRESWFARANAYQERVLAAGITHVCDAAVPPSLEALYREWQQRGELRVGITILPIADALLLDPAARLDGPPTGPVAGRLAIGALKLFLDGGVRCAMCFTLRDAIWQFATLMGKLLRAPSRVPWRLALQQRGRLHADGMVHMGLLYYDAAALAHIVGTATQRGFGIAMHAAGNAAIRQAVGSLGRTRRGTLPPRVDHFFFAEPDTVQRAADDGIVAVVQPEQLTETGDWILQTGLPGNLSYHGYRQMLDAGMTVAGSSDAPVVSFDVLRAIRAAVRRRVRSGATLAAEQRVTVAEALRMYTRNAAATLGIEGEIGQLSPGARSDAVVLNRNPLALSVDELDDLRVCSTFAGRVECVVEER
jgi:predicted amidohydrolase YtcJ